MADIVRIQPLDGRRFAVDGVSIDPAPPADRLILRAGENARASIGEALGTALPGSPKTSASKDGISVLWLGPDEWMVIAEAGSDPARKLSGLDETCSAVDISHRNTAIILSGNRAADIIAAGCPQDLSLSAFPAGACSRTVFGKAEIVLCREAIDLFRIECWRSFSDYVWRFLTDAAKSA